jgi:hypothetical protein
VLVNGVGLMVEELVHGSGSHPCGRLEGILEARRDHGYDIE